MRFFLRGGIIWLLILTLLGLLYFFFKYSYHTFRSPPELSDEEIRDIADSPQIIQQANDIIKYNIDPFSRPRYLQSNDVYFIAGSRNNTPPKNTMLCMNSLEDTKKNAYRANIIMGWASDDITIEYKETHQYFEVKFLWSKRIYRTHKCTYFDPSGFSLWSTTENLLGVFWERPINSDNFSQLAKYLVSIWYPGMVVGNKIYENVLETWNLLEYVMYDISHWNMPWSGCWVASLEVSKITIDKTSGEVRSYRHLDGSKSIFEKRCQSSDGNGWGNPWGFAVNPTN